MGRSSEAAIFRRFNEINMLNLLNLQAEIAALRKEFWLQCNADAIRGPPYENLSLSFETQRSVNSVNDPKYEHQYHILLRLRAKMKEYSECSTESDNLFVQTN